MDTIYKQHFNQLPSSSCSMINWSGGRFLLEVRVHVFPESMSCTKYRHFFWKDHTTDFHCHLHFGTGFLRIRVLQRMKWRGKIRICVSKSHFSPRPKRGILLVGDSTTSRHFPGNDKSSSLHSGSDEQQQLLSQILVGIAGMSSCSDKTDL